jgi:type II secretory pathway predicted ATPase ExeA
MLRYYQHFGLQRDPFLDTADPHFYCELPAVRRNAARIIGSIEGSCGLTVVIGAPGTGKTSLSASVEQALLNNEHIVIGKILDPTFASDVEFLLAIGRVFGLALPPRSPAALKNALKNFFFDTAVLEEKTLLLVVDEAQNLNDDGLETLRMLLNFQIPARKLLNVVLYGQSELEQHIYARENLHDRVDAYVRLDALDAAAAAALLEHRLVRGGKTPTVRIFASDALQLTIAAGDGLPRRLTTIARGAMTEAAERSAEIVGIDHVVAALRGRGLPVPSLPQPAPEDARDLRAETSPVASTAPATPAAAPRVPFFQRLFARRA